MDATKPTNAHEAAQEKSQYHERSSFVILGDTEGNLQVNLDQTYPSSHELRMMQANIMSQTLRVIN